MRAEHKRQKLDVGCNVNNEKTKYNAPFFSLLYLPRHNSSQQQPPFTVCVSV